jgi:hypothetical protein
VSQNRRTQTRFDVSIVTEMTCEGKTSECTMVNLSHGGAFMVFPRLPMGTLCKVKFSIPTQPEAIETPAIVRWCTDQGVGVQFEGLRAKEVYALGKYFEQLA